MPYRFKRVKYGPPVMVTENGQPTSRAGKPATHYVKSMRKEGTITGWTPNIDEALAVTKEQAEAVRERYQGKENVPDFYLEPINDVRQRPVEAKPEPEPEPITEPAKPVAEPVVADQSKNTKSEADKPVNPKR